MGLYRFRITGTREEPHKKVILAFSWEERFHPGDHDLDLVEDLMNGGAVRFGLRGKKWLLLTFAVVLASWIAFFVLSPSPFQNRVSFSASPPAKTDVSCLGRLLPGGRILQVAAPSRAMIRDLLVRRGQWVEQGEILARLRDHARETALLHQAEKEVAVAVSELDRVRAGEKVGTIEAQQAAVVRQETILRNEDAQYERNRKLFEKRLISGKDIEEAQTRRDTARESLLYEKQHLRSLKDIRKEDLALAASKVEATESARKVAVENVELNLIRAPVSGRVLEIYAFPGEAVPERGLLELGSGRDMLVEAEVYVSDIGRVRVGAPAFISGDGFPGNLKGEVVEIVPMVTRSALMPTDPLAFSDLRIVKVWIRLEDSNPVAHLGNHQVSVTIKP
jgi:HlyD family secretion protein